MRTVRFTVARYHIPSAAYHAHPPSPDFTLRDLPLNERSGAFSSGVLGDESLVEDLDFDVDRLERYQDADPFPSSVGAEDICPPLDLR